MKHLKQSALVLFVALTAAILVSSARVAVAADPAGAITEENVIEKVGQAKTKADHEALAAYFRSEAKEKADAAASHEAMLKSWGKDAGRPKEHMRSHCQTLIDAYTREQKALETLAGDQEKLAK
ncbi:MAG: hypothetical protein HY270_05630 [Deltaproteobacteria bacterium]|nr:hypothetical protein [Deltaproteobacteria bacterium]